MVQYLVKWIHPESESHGIDLVTEEEFEKLRFEQGIEVEEFQSMPSYSKLFRVIVAGSRTFNDYELLKETLDYMLQNKKNDAIVILSGKAKGADTLGEKYAAENDYIVDDRPADWDRWGKRAGYIRNEEMAKNAEACIVFRVNMSKGSTHMINLAEKYGLKLKVVDIEQ